MMDLLTYLIALRLLLPTGADSGSNLAGSRLVACLSLEDGSGDARAASWAVELCFATLAPVWGASHGSGHG